MMQPANEAHKTNDQSENAFMEKAYSIFLPFGAQ